MPTCPTCHAVFEPKGGRGHPRSFCSCACRNKANIDGKKRRAFTCEGCGQVFSTWTYRRPRFCSRLCSNRWAAKQPKPAARVPPVRLHCARCGKPYSVKRGYFALRGSRFCSLKCRYDGASVERRGAGNPHWKGGLSKDDYGPNWSRQSRRVKRRDGGCRACGYKAGGSRFLDVHHIIPFRSFGDDYERANQLSNLIELCRPCHALVESGRLPCPIVPRRGTADVPELPERV